MKKLSVLRHAKSDWNDDVDDHDRPLNKRGHREAPQVGALLCDVHLWPQHIGCSTALRTRQTLGHMLEHAEGEVNVAYEPSLYLPAVDAVMEYLRGMNNDWEHAMILAHNPGVSHFASQLLGQHIAMPTAALAVLELPIDRWNELSGRTVATLRMYWTPKAGTKSFAQPDSYQ